MSTTVVEKKRKQAPPGLDKLGGLEFKPLAITFENDPDDGGRLTGSGTIRFDDSTKVMSASAALYAFDAEFKKERGEFRRVAAEITGVTVNGAGTVVTVNATLALKAQNGQFIDRNRSSLTVLVIAWVRRTKNKAG